MKFLNKLVLIVCSSLAALQAASACPTCIGRLELQSPTFFSDELYQLRPEDDVHVDQTVKKGVLDDLSKPARIHPSGINEEDDDD